MTERDYNIDLLRVLSTVFVLVLHVLGEGGVLRSAASGSAVYWTAWLLEILVYCAVNCFALISGYIMVNKTIRLKSIAALWLHALFYSLLITALFLAFVPETRSLWNVIVAFFPVTGKQWWYISAYFMLLFFIPLLNQVASSITQATYKKFLIVILIVVCLIDRVIPVDSFALSSGYSPAWLILVYLLGAYLRKYRPHERITAAQGALGFFAMILLTFLSKLFIYYTTKSIFGHVKYEDTFISYTSITIVMAAIFLFALCMNVKVGTFAKKIIGFFAPMTLGVYLIHVQPLVFGYVIQDAFAPLAQQHPAVMVGCVLAWALTIFLLCSGIDLMRIRLFKLARVDRVCQMAENKIMGLYRKVFKESL